MMEICENPGCKVWLHEQCIIDDVLTNITNSRIMNGLNRVKSEDTKAGMDNSKVKIENSNSDIDGSASKTNGKKSKSTRKIWEGKFKGKLNPGSEKAPTTISITELKPGGRGTWTERIPCPKCGTWLE